MIAWFALILAFLSCFIASLALGVGLWVYFKGPRIKCLEPDELLDLLLEDNTKSYLFKEDDL